MSPDLQPNLSILAAPQKRLWSELVSVPHEFVLCGGTAIALRLGHRPSIDFDFFGSDPFDPDELYEGTPFLAQSRVVQKSANTLTCIVDREGPVQISFFGVPRIKLVKTPSRAPDNGVAIASLLDLAGMKCAVVQKRAEAKDYIDVDAILTQGEVSLPQALSAGKQIYGASFQPQIALKSLAFYEDGDLPSLPQEVQDRLAAAVKAVDLSRLPTMDVERGGR